MASTSRSKKFKPAKSSPTPERGVVMNGAEILVASLEREGVEFIFA